MRISPTFIQSFMLKILSKAIAHLLDIQTGKGDERVGVARGCENTLFENLLFIREI